MKSITESARTYTKRAKTSMGLTERTRVAPAAGLLFANAKDVSDEREST